MAVGKSEPIAVNQWKSRNNSLKIIGLKILKHQRTRKTKAAVLFLNILSLIFFKVLGIKKSSCFKIKKKSEARGNSTSTV